MIVLTLCDCSNMTSYFVKVRCASPVSVITLGKDDFEVGFFNEQLVNLD